MVCKKQGRDGNTTMSTQKKQPARALPQLFGKRRANEFVILEQEDDSDSEAADVAYTPPKDRLLATPDVSDSMSEKDASVDQKIDSYLIKYEKDAVSLGDEDEQAEQNLQPGTSRPLAEKASVSLYSALFEQAEGDPPSPPDLGGGGAPGGAGGMPDMGGGMPDLGGGMPDLGAGPGGGGEGGKPAEVAPVPKINIRRFAEGVARLVMNYKALINPEAIILNRAMFYIAKNYSPRLAKELMSILERDFDLTPKNITQKKAEVPPAPRAAGSGPDDGGGAPAGGGGGGG